MPQTPFRKSVDTLDIQQPLDIQPPDTQQDNTKLDIQPPTTQASTTPAQPSVLDKLKGVLSNPTVQKLAGTVTSGDPLMTPFRAAGVLAKHYLDTHIDDVVAQESGKKEGVFNPDPASNPLLGKSALPETTAQPGFIGGLRHSLYENLIRPMASPEGVIGSLTDAKAPTESGLLEAGLVKKPTADFIGSNEAGDLYRISGGPQHGATVDAATLKNMGIDVPEKPVPEPVQKLMDALDTSKGLNKEQAEIYRTERAEKFKKAADIPVTDEDSAHAKLAAMQGEHTKVSQVPPELDQDDINSLYGMINQPSKFTQADQLHAITGLGKVLNGQVPQDNEISIMEKVYGSQLVNQIRGSSGNIQPRNLLSEALNLPRAMETAIHFTAPFRQGGPLVGTAAWFKAWPDMIKAAASENTYQDIMKSIEERPNFARYVGSNGELQPSLAERAGLSMTELTSKLNKREEDLQSTLAEKVPGIRMSNRGYTTFLNKLRADTFDDLINQYKGLAKDSGDVSKDPTKNNVLLKQIGSAVNVATGRGDLFTGGDYNALLNGLFFSPRLMSSRLQMMGQMLNPKNYINLSEPTRKFYLASGMRSAALWVTLASLAKMGGADVSLDPTSSDFGKIKIGNTRLDPGQGFQQYLVLAARMAKGGYTSSTSNQYHQYGGKYGDETRRDALVDFAANKLAPIPKYVNDALTATNHAPFSVGDRTMRLFTPILIQDMSDLMQDNPNLATTLLGPLVGFGESTYSGSSNKRLIPSFTQQQDINIPSKRLQ